jgi:hypothetical protein
MTLGGQDVLAKCKAVIPLRHEINISIVMKVEKYFKNEEVVGALLY